MPFNHLPLALVLTLGTTLVSCGEGDSDSDAQNEQSLEDCETLNEAQCLERDEEFVALTDSCVSLRGVEVVNETTGPNKFIACVPTEVCNDSDGAVEQCAMHAESERTVIFSTQCIPPDWSVCLEGLGGGGG